MKALEVVLQALRILFGFVAVAILFDRGEYAIEYINKLDNINIEGIVFVLSLMVKHFYVDLLIMVIAGLIAFGLTKPINWVKNKYAY